MSGNEKHLIIFIFINRQTATRFIKLNVWAKLILVVFSTSGFNFMFGDTLFVNHKTKLCRKKKKIWSDGFSQLLDPKKSNNMIINNLHLLVKQTTDIFIYIRQV